MKPQALTITCPFNPNEIPDEYVPHNRLTETVEQYDVKDSRSGIYDTISG